ncbi:hypothetical protein AVEN_146473-1 [Araneus ventricosus]|uniref:HAT C-terminal dimerisation domain-containing protein n=1 Tax=Araneus ventricosus TaxID=182803 RepID=A0A4Y2K1C3_ARAVE|nr:hypothetical protein AVEN_146473-1 [Araneus ventricosus]
MKKRLLPLETPQLAPPEEVVDSTAFTTQKSFDLLTRKCCEKQFKDVMDVTSLYYSDIDSDIVKGEFELCKKKKKWQKVEPNQRPKTAVEALNEPEIKLLFPNISKLLNISGVLPVTTATLEISFSTLRRTKTYLRSTMGEDRLTGLSFHRSRDIDIAVIIDRLAARRSRRLSFII